MNIRVLIPAYRPDDKLLATAKRLIPAVNVLIIDDGIGFGVGYENQRSRIPVASVSTACL